LAAVVIPWGGGGLACGIASALKALKPGVRVFAAEAETGAPLSASWAAGRPVEVAYQPSFIDGISAKTVFPRMFEEAKTLLDGSIVVTVADAVAAMKLVAERARVIIEGAAACAVAAALSGKAGPGKVVAIVSGGNIDLAKFAELTR
jgi:threonine dehydratase